MLDELPMAYIEFDQFDLSKYKDLIPISELADHDLLYLDLEVLDIQQPDYMKVTEWVSTV